MASKWESERKQSGPIIIHPSEDQEVTRPRRGAAWQGVAVRASALAAHDGCAAQRTEERITAAALLLCCFAGLGAAWLIDKGAGGLGLWISGANLGWIRWRAGAAIPATRLRGLGAPWG